MHAATQRLFKLGRELKVPVQGVLVEQMLPFDHELLLGLRRDARFGPVLTIARGGGVEAELDPDVVNLLLPASQPDIVQAIEHLRCAKLLHGFRGKAGADIGKLSARIAELCSWFTAQSLQEVEINPFAIRGDDAWALDALITPQAA
ncbi:ATP-grasp domain protein [compost metagenome]